jgi:hypothetical protein
VLIFEPTFTSSDTNEFVLQLHTLNKIKLLLYLSTTPRMCKAAWRLSSTDS